MLRYNMLQNPQTFYFSNGKNWPHKKCPANNCTSRCIYWHTAFTFALHEYAAFFRMSLLSVTFKNEHMAIFYLIALIATKEHKHMHLLLQRTLRMLHGSTGQQQKAEIKAFCCCTAIKNKHKCSLTLQQAIFQQINI